MYGFMTIFLGLNGKRRFCLRKNREVLASFSNVILHRILLFSFFNLLEGVLLQEIRPVPRN
jgi:hypothetical protein